MQTSYGTTWTIDHIDLFKKLKKVWNLYDCNPSLEISILLHDSISTVGQKKKIIR